MSRESERAEGYHLKIQRWMERTLGIMERKTMDRAPEAMKKAIATWP